MSMLRMITLIALVGLLIVLILIVNNRPKKEDFVESERPTTLFPSLPERMNELEDSNTKERLKRLSKCLDVSRYEEQVREYVLNNQSNDHIPLLQTKDDCDTCKELTNVWNLYISRVNNIKDFARTGIVPIAKPTAQSIKPCCTNMDAVFRNYNEKLLKEVMCYVKNAKTRDFSECGNIGLPDDYGMDKDCQDCSSLYEKWFMYTSFLIDIQNYVSSPSLWAYT